MACGVGVYCPVWGVGPADVGMLPFNFGPGPVPRLSGSIRIRQPRWTPSLPVGDGEPDLIALDILEDTSEKSS